MRGEEAGAASASAGAAAARKAAQDVSWPAISTAAAYLVDPTPQQSPEEAAQIGRLFDEFDSDNSGALSRDELQVALKHLGLPSTPEYVDQLIAQYDTDGNGQVERGEFQDYVARKEAAIQRAFEDLDQDRTGEVDETELMHAMRKLGLPCKPEDAERMISLLDRDGDQQIDYGEFRRFVVLLPSNQLSGGSIVSSWIDSADWMAGIEYRLNMTPPQQLYERLVAGGVAGAVSRTVVAPLERLRTMMMADARNASLPQTVRKMWADGGLRGLFKGNLATVTKVVPQCAIQMTVYDSVKDMFQANSPDVKLTNLQRLTAGITAGAASTIVTYPMENLRTHVSLGRSGGYFKILREIYESRGMVRGVYGGFNACMVNTVSTTGLGFLGYELGCDFYRSVILDKPRAPTPGERGVIAGAAAVGVMAVTMPLEVAARRMQVQGSPGHPVKYSNLADCFRVILREEGPRAFWRGTLSSWAKVVPSIAIVRYMYEAINQFQGSTGIRSYRRSRAEPAAAKAS